MMETTTPTTNNPIIVAVPLNAEETMARQHESVSRETLYNRYDMWCDLLQENGFVYGNDFSIYIEKKEYCVVFYTVRAKEYAPLFALRVKWLVGGA